ncbi:MAG: SirA-like protein [Candidatus Cloacimonas sp. 4484_275]|jgi:tRNA 2-thiouridine synthesizing protein A|nr:MAG: SirA-like protein [Candidatus Cloacimonas sp. 4484_275]RLC51188.1 MAG: SirA-like protein [Candidatus Cloacimonadota bacterium]
MVELNLLGLKCPEPVLKIASKVKEIPDGEMLDVIADCPSFPKDIEAWCERTGKTLLFCMDEGDGKYHAQIQL